MEETKICSKCKKPFPATSEHFNKNASTPDGLDYYCKHCKAESQKDRYRSRKNNPKSEKKKAEKKPTRRRVAKQTGSVKEPLTMASPEAIIAALRKGVAREIITLIEKGFGTV